MPPSDETEHAWMRHARWTAWGANFFWWLQRFLPLFLGLNLVSAAVVIYARQQSWPQERILGLYFGAMVILALVALGLAWKRFLSQRDGLLRLEEHLGLKNSLSAAQEGVIAWPPLPEASSLPYHFRWGNVATPVSASAILLIIGCLIPVDKAQADVAIDNPEQPVAWEELDSWVEELEENEVIEQSALEELEQKLAELRQQPAEDWFTQSSLEAGENLRDQTQQDMQKLAEDMLKASALMDAMREGGMDPNSMEAKALEGALQKALQSMELGTTPLNSELMEQLKQMGNCQACQGGDAKKYKLVKGKLAKDGKLLAKLAKLSDEDLEKMIMMACQMPAGSKIKRGRNDAPLTAKADESRVKPGQIEGVSNDDMRSAALGETIAIQDRAPDEDEAGEVFSVTASSGSDALGQGGDVVWKNNLSPEERKLLEQYFQ